MSEPLEREWRFYVTDMISFAEKVVLYTDGKPKPNWNPPRMK